MMFSFITPNITAATPNTTTTPNTATTQSSSNQLNQMKQPTCTLDFETCQRLWVQYVGLEAGDESNIVDPGVLLPILILACREKHICHLGLQNEIALFYWPENVSKDVCALNDYGTVRSAAG
jgi:hypothetical protein